MIESKIKFILIIKKIVKPFFDKQDSLESIKMDEECLILKGQMLLIEEWNAIIYLATPILDDLEVMYKAGLFLNDLSMHDSSRDLVLVGTQQSAQLKLSLDREKEKNKALEDSMMKLDIEMKKTDNLLYQMIPKKIADKLRLGEPLMNLCEVIYSFIDFIFN
jgi:guanylate cyclase, other